MHVDDPMHWGVQDMVRKNLAVGDHGADLCAARGQLLAALWITRAVGLKDWKVERHRCRLDGRKLLSLTPTTTPVGLGHDHDDLFPGGDESLE